MDLVLAEIFSSILVFCILIGCSFIPFTLITCRGRRRASAFKDHPSATATSSNGCANNLPFLSLCNCFAAGVFIATCFLGLVPHVREHVTLYEQLKSSHHNDNDTRTTMTTMSSSFNPMTHLFHNKNDRPIPWTEVLLIGGFLLILLIEELIHLCQHCDGCRNRKKGGVKKSNGGGNKDKPTKEQRSLKLNSFEDEPLITAAESRDDGDDTEKLSLHDISSPSKSGGHHDHHDPSTLLVDGDSLSWRSVALLLGLGIHGAFEGVALGLQETPEALFSLLFGVMTHEILCAVAFGINLAGHGVRYCVGFLTIVMFSVSIPLGMIGGFVVRLRQATTMSSLLARIILEGLAAGTFVYVAFVDMLNHELATNKCRLAKVLCVCFGFLLFFAFTLFA